MAQAEVRTLCTTFGIKKAFKHRETGKLVFVRTDTLRDRLNALREGRAESFFMDGKEMSDRESDSNVVDQEEVEEVIPPIPELPKPVVTVEVEDNPAEAMRKVMEVMAKAARAGQMTPDQVRQMVATGTADAKAEFKKTLDELRDKFNEGLKKVWAKASEGGSAKVVVVQDPQGNVRAQIDEHVHDKFDVVLRKVRARLPVRLVGPAGSGKSYIPEQISKLLNKEAEARGEKPQPFRGVSCTAGASDSIVTGRLIPWGEGGKFEWIASDYARACMEGGVFLFDEMDKLDPNTASIVNWSMSSNTLLLPNNPNQSSIPIHKNRVVMATMNTFGGGGDRMYTSSIQQDVATTDRFTAGTIFIDYDQKLEKRIMADLDALEILEWGWKVRKSIMTYQLRRVLSTRVMKDFAAEKAIGGTMKDFKESYFLGWSDDDKRKVESGAPGSTK